MKQKQVKGASKAVPLHKFTALCIKRYGTEVITNRAIADFRDGLKPVHRKVLWSCHELKAVNHNEAAAAIVGNTQGKYHPHGDTSIFAATVKLASSLRYPLLIGQGNWGDPITGDEESAMRYISGRLSPLGVKLFERAAIFKMIKNYDGRHLEPLVIDTYVPLLFMNGVSGVAVGLAVNIPPHNLKNLVTAFKLLIRDKTAPVREIVKVLKHPDYMQGSVLTSPLSDIINMYETGQGTLRYRCKYHYEDTDQGYKLLVVDSAAPNFSTPAFKEKVAKFVQERWLETWYEETVDVKNAGAQAHNRLRICIGFTNAAFIKKKVLPLLNTTVTYSFAYVENLEEEQAVFKTGNIKDLMLHWLDAQRDQEARWLKHLKDVSNQALFKVEAKLAGIRHIDTIASALKTKDPEAFLMRKLGWSKERTNYILDVKVRTLSNLNAKALKDEQAKIRKTLKELDWKLAHINVVIDKNLTTLAGEFGDPMRTVREKRVANAAEDLPTTQVQVVIAGKTDGKLWLDSNRTRKKADFVCVTDDQFLAITRGGQFQMLDCAMSLSKAAADLVAIQPPNELVALVDNIGKFLVCECPIKGSTRLVWLMKTKGRLVKAVTLSYADTLVIQTAKGMFEIKSKRAIKKLQRSPKTAGTFYSGKKVKDIHVISKRAKGTFKYKGFPVFGFGKENVVLMRNGSRKYLDIVKTGKLDEANIKDIAILS